MLFVLGLGAALVIPALAFEPAPVVTLERVVQAGRERAIARAQPLALVVGRDGRWWLRTASTEGLLVDSGRVAKAPLAEIEVHLTPLGACAVAGRPSDELRDWDAARCAPRHGGDGA